MTQKNINENIDENLLNVKQRLTSELNQINKQLRKKKAVIRSSAYIKSHVVKCELCGITTNKYNYEKHLKTKRHLRNMEELS